MRPWNEFVARWQDMLSLSLTVLVLILGALIVGALWFFWPAWWKALLRMRWRPWKRKEEKERGIREVTEEEIDKVTQSDEELPEVAPVVFLALADRLAAQGRFAEAVRERLRAMVRELVDSGVIRHHPEWTITELAREAGAAKAVVAAPIDAASNIFTAIWYAKKPAESEDDQRMRLLATQLTQTTAGGRK